MLVLQALPHLHNPNDRRLRPVHKTTEIKLRINVQREQEYIP